MDNTNEACPTEILIDLKDDDAIPSYMNLKEKDADSYYHKSELYLQNKGNNLKQENQQSILDASPSRISDEYKDFHLNMILNTDIVQSMKLKEAVDVCPTAILVDVPSPSRIQEDEIYTNSSVKNCSEEDFADSSPNLNETNNQLSIPRLRWKTPSPQSMSRISKEASKVIYNLNSSAIFDDDSLITEEILPIPINFDNFDFEDNTDEENLSCSENTCENDILNSSINAQTQNVVIDAEIIDKKIVDCSSLPTLKENITIYKKSQESPIKLPSEASICKVNLGNSDDLDSNSKELCSSKIQSDCLCNSEFSAINDSMDEVFIARYASEDKENIQIKENCAIFPEKIKINGKTEYKNSFKSKTKLEFRGTLRNLSNIKFKTTDSAKCLSSNDHTKVITPHRKINVKGKMKEIEPSTGKLQMKKTSSTMTSQNTSRMISQSNLFQSSRESISSVEKPCLTMKNTSFFCNSVCKSSSSDIKQTAFSKMKTPQKRYSVSTPSKSASAIKPPLTPALQSFPNPSVPRYTPQSVRGSRFSFSKSWQQPADTSHFLNSKILKQRDSTSIAVPSKINFGRINSSMQGKQSFSQSMSAASFRSSEKNSLSASSKSRFCSKLSIPSPLPVDQDRKLARALFPSVPKK